MLSTLRTIKCYTHAATPDRGNVVTLIAESNKRHRLLFAETGDEVFATRSLNVMPKTTKQNLIVRIIRESEAAITNNKRLHSRYCSVEVN